MYCVGEPAAEDAHMDGEPQEDLGWQHGISDGPPQQQQQLLQQQQQQQEWQPLHLVDDCSPSPVEKQAEENFISHASVHESEPAAPSSKGEAPVSLEPVPDLNPLQGTVHKAEQRKRGSEPQCTEQRPQHQQHQQHQQQHQRLHQQLHPQGTRLSAGAVDVASRGSEKPQHAKSHETSVHKEGRAEGCCPPAADEVPAAQRRLHARKQQVEAQPLRPGMQLNGLALKVLHDSRGSGAAVGVCTVEGYGAACGEHAAADSHTSTIQKSPAPPAASVLPAPAPVYESSPFLGYPNPGRGPHPEQQGGPRMPHLLQQPSIDLTLQQAVRLIELDGISLKQRARHRQPAPQQNSSPHSQQQQQQQKLQQQQSMLRQAAGDRHAPCSTAAAQQGPLQKWPTRPEAPGHTEDQGRRRGPSKETRRASLEESMGFTSDAMQMPRSQAKSQLPPFRERTHSREFLYQQQQQALLRRMHQQHQQRQAVQRRQQRLTQLKEQGGWAGSVVATTSSEAPSCAPQAMPAWQQLLDAAAPSPVKSKSFESPAAECYSMSTALELCPALPEAPGPQQHRMQVDTWGGQQQMQQQQRKARAKVTYQGPLQGSPPRRLLQPGDPSSFLARDPVNPTQSASFTKAPVMGRAAEASSSLGFDSQGSRWAGASPQTQPEELRVPPALAVPPVGCATSYEELIAFFRGLAEQQRPPRHEGMGTYHEGLTPRQPYRKLPFGLLPQQRSFGL
ncbi:hypothetical protein ACSSS7_004384 [Eimeria intestinalis]